MKGLINSLKAEALYQHRDRAFSFGGCIVCDLLSYVVANSQKGQVWITHHTHPNIIAVAMLKELAGIIVVGGGKIDPETISRARSEAIPLYVTDLGAYEAACIVCLNDSVEGC